MIKLRSMLVINNTIRLSGLTYIYKDVIHKEYFYIRTIFMAPCFKNFILKVNFGGQK